MFACIYGKNVPDSVSLAEFAYAFSPLVEETAPDTVVIDTEGCELRFGSHYELANEVANHASRAKADGGLGLRINVALAGNPDTAILAARFFKGITFISPGEELTALGELSIEGLLSSTSNVQVSKSKKQTLDFELQETLETLRLWGVRTFRDFAALPTTGVAERLGQEGVRLQQLARGKTERHLTLKQPAPVFEYSIELEHSLRELEPLSFIFARLLNQLCASLIAYALATNELQVRMELEDGTSHERKLNLPSPMRDHKAFLKLLLLDTEIHPPQKAIIAVSIACQPVKPRLLQNGLFIPQAPEPEKLELTLARLAKLVGSENVGSAELVDTHRPDAFRVKRFVVRATREKRGGRGDAKTPRHRDTETVEDKSSGGKASASAKDPRVSPFSHLCFSNEAHVLPVMGFRVLRPPLRAMVEASRGYPTQVSAWGANRSVYGKVVRLAGPWRTTGDWWRNDCWTRDEWDVAIESRAESSNPGGHAMPCQVLYRIYRELSSGSWFVNGIYD